MQTEPEQWAVELWHLAHRAYVLKGRDSHLEGAADAALLLQRAFEERERKLREAMKGIETRHGWCVGKCRACDFARQALKETPDAR